MTAEMAGIDLDNITIQGEILANTSDGVGEHGEERHTEGQTRGEIGSETVGSVPEGITERDGFEGGSIMEERDDDGGRDQSGGVGGGGDSGDGVASSGSGGSHGGGGSGISGGGGGRNGSEGRNGSVDRGRDSGGYGVLYTSAYVNFELVIYGMCFVLILVGNTVTMAATWKFKWMKEKIYMTLKALTLADLFVPVYISILFLYRFRVVGKSYRRNLRYVVLYTQDMALINSSFHIILLALDRFVAVLYPYFYDAKITKNSLKGLSAAIWLYSAVFPIFGGEVGKDLFNLSHWIYVSEIVVYVTVGALMIYLNGRVACIANRQQNRIDAMQRPTETNVDETPPRQKKIISRPTIMMLVVVCIFLILWFPRVISSIIMIANSEVTVLYIYGRRIKYWSHVKSLRQRILELVTLAVTLNVTIDLAIRVTLNLLYRN